MTNLQRQKKLDKKKWLLSEKLGVDKSGDMDYCGYCLYQDIEFNCFATQLDREMNCLCAKAYNKMAKDTVNK